MEIEEHAAFRVTRDADFEIEETSDDLLSAVEHELRRRRFGEVVRVELAGSMSAGMRHQLLGHLHADDAYVYAVDGLLDLADLVELAGLDRPDLRYPEWQGVTRPRLRGDGDQPADIFGAIREGDILVNHPYDRFSTSVERLIEQAVDDPDVLAIKHTIYRTSGDSPMVPALMRAAEQGKQAVVLVELKARFDEARNIGWARALERAGVHVVHGFPALKTHAKCALVVRRESGGIRRYVHIGTGNYHPRTARLYTDAGLFTCRPDIAADVSDLFNYLTGFGRPQRYRKLLVAPTDLRERIIAEVRRVAADTAAGTPGRIVLKMNGLVDRPVIESLYEASQAGVKVDLVVRGICCLRPGVRGLSENIRVVSVLGRFLEHERLFAFHGKRVELLPRLGRHDAAQPRFAGRGAGARRGSQPPQRGRRVCSRHPSPTRGARSSSRPKGSGSAAAPPRASPSSRPRRRSWSARSRRRASPTRKRIARPSASSVPRSGATRGSRSGHALRGHRRRHEHRPPARRRAGGGAPDPAHTDKELVRLGRDLAHNSRISDESLLHVSDALRRFRTVARKLGAADLRIIATSAAREAENGQELAARVLTDTGHELEIIDEDEEARLAWVGALNALDEPWEGEVGVVDVGGGSTEIVVGSLDGRHRVLALLQARLGPADRSLHRARPAAAVRARADPQDHRRDAAAGRRDPAAPARLGRRRVGLQPPPAGRAAARRRGARARGPASSASTPRAASRGASSSSTSACASCRRARSSSTPARCDWACRCGSARAASARAPCSRWSRRASTATPEGISGRRAARPARRTRRARSSRPARRP